MRIRAILTSIIFLFGALTAQAANPAKARSLDPERLFHDLREAFSQNNNQRLSALAPLAKGHVLEPWAAYWELKARLENAHASEVNTFLRRYAGTYQEDRLRNDWLLVVGKRQDWATFAEHASQFRMQDDRQVRCYTLAMENALARLDMADEVKALWMAQKNEDDGCTLAARSHFQRRHLEAKDIWQKVYLAIENFQFNAARQALDIVDPQAISQLNQVIKRPERYLATQPPNRQARTQHLAVVALIRWADSKPESAARMLANQWGKFLEPGQRDWAWSVIGKQAAQNLSDEALTYFTRVRPDRMLDDHLTWRVRAALRRGQWNEVSASIDAMQAQTRQDSAWIYWRARAVLQLANTESEKQKALGALRQIAGIGGFYEMLAAEMIGQPLTLPPPPEPPSEAEMRAARQNPGLRRALAAFELGLRSEAVREWNYTTNMHVPGGMSDRELLAAAQLACNQQVWDRCINTSERTKQIVDVKQRFPMPHEQAVLAQSKAIGLDPSYVYGLIRQESRFITDARSSVGASGLMQVMPKTAQWTAQKIGLSKFKLSQLQDRDVNIAIGTGYLKLVLDSFDGSLPLAAAAYNAGPSRSRSWRKSVGEGALDAAIWTENIPFAETRNYVKKVLANATVYATVISGQAQSVQTRLGVVTAKAGNETADSDMP